MAYRRFKYQLVLYAVILKRVLLVEWEHCYPRIAHINGCKRRDNYPTFVLNGFDQLKNNCSHFTFLRWDFEERTDFKKDCTRSNRLKETSLGSSFLWGLESWRFNSKGSILQRKVLCILLWLLSTRSSKEGLRLKIRNTPV